MKVSRENCPVKPLIGKMKREKIVLKHKLQRRESVWSNPNKSLLIDSLLRGILYHQFILFLKMVYNMLLMVYSD